MLEFGPLALTRAMCPVGSLHDELVRQWPYVRSYRRQGWTTLSVAHGRWWNHRVRARALTARLPMNAGTCWAVRCALVSILLLRGLRAASRAPGAACAARRRRASTRRSTARCRRPKLQHPGESGFRLVVEGTEAFVIRAHSAQLAARSLDVQTYIWHADTTGLYLAQQVLQAADRGVRVRLLVDDFDARAKNAGFAAIAAHPTCRSPSVQSLRLAQRRAAPGQRGCARFRAHQSPHAQQELDRRQPHRAGGWPQSRR